MTKRRSTKPAAEKTVRDIRRATRRKYSAEEKIRMVMEGLRTEESIGEFVAYYNHERYHESLKNLTPADVYYGRGQTVLDHREKIKLKTLAMRRQMHYDRLTNQAT